MEGIIRDFFAGGNTWNGFYSYFEYILPQEDAQRIFCFKGGPGTGKSTFMKEVGNHFKNKGYDIEFHHCSSDSTSLDGVVIKDLNIALIDGTSPHVVDPKTPGAVDEIINLGEFWNESGLLNKKAEIMTLSNHISQIFKRVYKYLGACKFIYDSWSDLISYSINVSEINLLKESLKNNLFKDNICKAGYVRHLFCTAFTPNGIVTFIGSLSSNCKNVYVLNGDPGSHKSDILKYLSDEAVKRGYYVELFHHPLVPEKIEHLIIPQLSTAVLTSNEINKKKFDGNQIYMKDTVDEDKLNLNKEKINEDKQTFYILLNKALTLLASEKKLHDELESYYVSNMNFSKLNSYYDSFIKRLDKYEENYKKYIDSFKQNRVPGNFC